MNSSSQKWVKAILELIDSGEDLLDCNLSDLLDFQVCGEVVDSQSLTEDIRSLIKLGDRYFILNWCRGGYTGQEDSFYEQPIEVFNPETSYKLLQLTSWHDKDGQVLFMEKTEQ